MKHTDNTKKIDFTEDIVIPLSEAKHWEKALTNKGFKPATGPNSWIKPVKIFPVKFADGKYGKIVFNEDSHTGFSVSGYLEDENHIVIDRAMNMRSLPNNWFFRDEKGGKKYRIRFLKRTDKTYAVKVNWTLSKTYEVKATSSKDSEKKRPSISCSRVRPGRRPVEEK